MKRHILTFSMHQGSGGGGGSLAVIISINANIIKVNAYFEWATHYPSYMHNMIMRLFIELFPSFHITRCRSPLGSTIAVKPSISLHSWPLRACAMFYFSHFPSFRFEGNRSLLGSTVVSEASFFPYTWTLRACTEPQTDLGSPRRSLPCTVELLPMRSRVNNILL